MKEDTRFVYGANCAWWGPIQDVKVGAGMPACPHCGSVLFEMPHRHEFFQGAAAYDRKKPGYTAFIEWVDGKYALGEHFSNMSEALEAYRKKTGSKFTL